MIQKKITKEEISNYKKLLEEYGDTIKIDVLALTPTQRRFFNTVIALVQYPDLPRDDLATMCRVSERTVRRAIDVIKEMVLPYRRNDSMISRIIEVKSLGKEKTNSIRHKLDRTKTAQWANSVR